MILYNNSLYRKDLNTAVKQVVNLDKLNNKRILIFGATGLIGSFITDLLLYYNETQNSDITIYAASRSIDKLQSRFGAYKTDKLIFLEQDLSKEFNSKIAADYIIHSANNSHPASIMGAPVDTILSNITGTKSILDEYKNNRILFISSGEVYGNSDAKEHIETEPGILDSLNLRACYPLSKRMTENLIVAHGRQYGSDCVIARLCHTYGPCSTKEDSRANAQFIENVLDNKDIVMNSKGLNLRSYCYIADSASALLTVMINGERTQAYNISYDKSVLTIAEYANLVAKLSGKKVLFESPDEDEVSKQTFIMRQVLCNDKLRNLGWNGSYSPESGINNTLQILRECGDNQC